MYTLFVWLSNSSLKPRAKKRQLPADKSQTYVHSYESCCFLVAKKKENSKGGLYLRLLTHDGFSQMELYLERQCCPKEWIGNLGMKLKVYVSSFHINFKVII